MPVPDDYRLLLDMFPPVDQFPDQWPLAIEAIGQPLPPDSPVDLVLEVRADASDSGSLDGIRFTYTTEAVPRRVAHGAHADISGM